MTKMIYKTGVFILMICLLTALQPVSDARAEMKLEEVEELLEFTAFADYYSRICLLLPGFYGSKFKVNYKTLKDQYQLKLLKEDPDMSINEARNQMEQFLREISFDARALVDAVGCEGEEKDLFLDHYNDLANTSPEEFAKRLMRSGTARENAPVKSPAQRNVE